MPEKKLSYTVGTFRAVGFEAKWTKTRTGTPIIKIRKPDAVHAHQREKWWLVDGYMWARIEAVGLIEAFSQCTMLGDVFSIPG